MSGDIERAADELREARIRVIVAIELLADATWISVDGISLMALADALRSWARAAERTAPVLVEAHLPHPTQRATTACGADAALLGPPWPLCVACAEAIRLHEDEQREAQSRVHRGAAHEWSGWSICGSPVGRLARAGETVTCPRCLVGG